MLGTLIRDPGTTNKQFKQSQREEGTGLEKETPSCAIFHVLRLCPPFILEESLAFLFVCFNYKSECPTMSLLLRT